MGLFESIYPAFVFGWGLKLGFDFNELLTNIFKLLWVVLAG
jgi:hypothetical protein